MSPTKTLPMITASELAGAFETQKRVLVTLENRKVYDVTEFLEDHPGGGDLIEEYAGKDVSEIMDDEVSHAHSESAYEMMNDDYLVAILATKDEEDDLLSDSNRSSFKLVAEPGSEESLSVQTDFTNDYEKHKFLDLNKALITQVLFGNFTREFYIEQVHRPRHYGKGSAPLFGNFMEPLSKTAWYVVPILWIPADMYALSLALEGLKWFYVLPLYCLGLFIWTLLEYLLHRFLFHLDDNLPQNNVAFTLHFLLHGVHHYLPMDPLRLVMPPALLIILTTPLYHLAHLLFPYYMAMSIFAGAFMGYIMYDCTHYFLHHAKLPAFLKPVKTYHLDHHYKDYQLGFGVTSKFWDVVFGTELVDTSKKR